MSSDHGSEAPHLLYVQDRFPVLSQTFVRNEVSELRDLGVRVSVATAQPPRRWWPAGRSEDEPGLRMGRLLGSHLHWLRRPGRYAAYLRALVCSPPKDWVYTLLAPAIARQARDQGVTHVHTHFAYRGASVARGVAALLQTSRSVTTHANDIFTRTPQLRARVSGARLLTISRYNQTFLADLGLASEVNHCGVDPSRLRRESLTDPEARSDVIFVGRLVPKKDPLGFLRAVRVLVNTSPSPISVVLAGSGPLADECRAFVEEHRLPVRSVGPVSHPEALRLIASSTVLCLPCREAEDGDLDGIPVSLMEAMALGTAVVTTSVSGIPELVTPEAGWVLQTQAALVDAAADALAAALRSVLTDGVARRAAVAQARQRIDQQFTLRDQALGVLRCAERAPVDAAAAQT